MLTRCVAIGLLCIFPACLFGAGRGAKVLGYHHGTVVLTLGGRYHVGALPAGWQEQKSSRNSVTFLHHATGAHITTGVYCGESYEDAALPTLMGQLFAGVGATDVQKATPFMLDAREALRQQSRRTIDGIAFFCDAVVLKKNACSFDLYLVSPPAVSAEMVPTFEAFFRGFRYE